MDEMWPPASGFCCVLTGLWTRSWTKCFLHRFSLEHFKQVFILLSLLLCVRWGVGCVLCLIPAMGTETKTENYHHHDEPDLWNWFVGGMWNRLRVGAKNTLAWRKQSIWVILVGAWKTSMPTETLAMAREVSERDEGCISAAEDHLTFGPRIWFLSTCVLRTWVKLNLKIMGQFVWQRISQDRWALRLVLRKQL